MFTLIAIIKQIAEYFPRLCTGSNVCATLPVIFFNYRMDEDKEYES